MIRKGLRSWSGLLLIVVGLAVTGCNNDSTDVSKELNDNYHGKVKGPPPPPGAMQPKGGAFVGQPMSISGPGGPPPGAAAGPGKASGPGH